MALTIDKIDYTVFGNKSVVFCDADFDSSYPTGGESLVAGDVGLTVIEQVYTQSKSGYMFSYDYTNSNLMVYFPSAAEESHTHAIALDSGASAAGASHNHVFTGTSPVSSLNLGTPAFSGTGLTASGQAITTTDTQTMTENQCAGMWLVPVTQVTPAVLILSNTAVSAAAAVLTVQGVAFTDSGTYKVVKSLTPIGTNAAEATHTHAWGTLADAVSGAATGTVGVAPEVTALTDLASLTDVKLMIIGY